MRILLVWAGRTRDREVRALVDRYLERVKLLIPCSLKEVREVQSSAKEQAAKRRERSEQRFRTVLPKQGFRVALDANGTELTSEAFTDLIRRHREGGTRTLVFLVGGPDGLPTSIRDEADLKLSLSTMTYPHELVRVFLLEQIYRATAALAGIPYSR
jgi:23S rRNA (pseudouridine1915-N3)-methyltransferase